MMDARNFNFVLEDDRAGTAPVRLGLWMVLRLLKEVSGTISALGRQPSGTSIRVSAVLAKPNRS